MLFLAGHASGRRHFLRRSDRGAGVGVLLHAQEAPSHAGDGGRAGAGDRHGPRHRTAGLLRRRMLLGRAHTLYPGPSRSPGPKRTIWSACPWACRCTHATLRSDRRGDHLPDPLPAASRNRISLARSSDSTWSSTRRSGSSTTSCAIRSRPIRSAAHSTTRSGFRWG